MNRKQITIKASIDAQGQIIMTARNCQTCGFWYKGRFDYTNKQRVYFSVEDFLKRNNLWENFGMKVLVKFNGETWDY